MRRESTIEHYRDFRDQKQDDVERFGLNTANNLELIWKRDAQEALLCGRQLDLRTISSFLAPRYHPLRERTGMSTVLRAGAIMTRSAYQYPFMSVDFGTRAVKKGESKEFKERVQQALLEAKSRTPLLDPLLAPGAITVLYLPPPNASKIDLDNLMRESIIPSVHEIPRPTGSRVTF